MPVIEGHWSFITYWNANNVINELGKVQFVGVMKLSGLANTLMAEFKKNLDRNDGPHPKR